jgi:hypothetical protein
MIAAVAASVPPRVAASVAKGICTRAGQVIRFLDLSEEDTDAATEG